MTSIHSASSSKPEKGLIYRAANGLFKSPAKWDKWAKSGVEKDAFMSSTRNAARSFFGTRMKELVDYDYREFPGLVLGKYRIPLSEPPKGALLLLLYPVTVGSRLYRAYQRGKKNNDYREMGDVLRRDLTAITLFVFALGPVVQKLSGLTERLTGVKLLDPKSGQVLKYSQFKNYRIDNEATLKAILTEGNGHALIKAVDGLHDRGLESKYGKKDLAEAITKIQSSVKTLVNEFDKHHATNSAGQKAWPTDKAVQKNLDALVKETFGHFDAAEKIRTDAVNEAKKGGSAEMAKIATKMEGEFKGVLQNYAKVRRLPSDLISFAILVGAIGYLPMWVNTQWNQRQFDKKMATKAAASKNTQANPQVQPPIPQTAAKLPTSFAANGQSIPFQQMPTFVPQSPMFGSPMTQPFGLQPKPLAQTPFNRTL